MKNIIPLFSAAVLFLTACSPNTRTAKTADTDLNNEKSLFATMKMKDSYKVGEPVLLRFTVYNNADSIQQFCKWHTPFEPLMSKYLEVKKENGEEINYQGPMAKRMMPPPADSYVKVNPGDSLSVDVDVLKAYAIVEPAIYKIIYTGQGISGLVVKDSVAFDYTRP